ncbi:MAG TPA: sulfotransferase [Anaerolineales bacterium]|nr:sulfotransferase [Anaerolineales bacterium]
MNPLLRGLLSAPYRLLNQGLHVVECRFLGGNMASLPYAPVFIIGAPRSGSTVLYQVLTNYYDLGFLANLHCFFYGGPSLIENIVHSNRSGRPADYTSRFGKTEGWSSPSECGEFWYRFFRRRPPYVPLEEADPGKMKELRQAMIALGKAFQKPMIFKNLYCALRLRPIAAVLPEALFIVIRREIIDNAHSILEGRGNVKGDYSSWWSAEPPGVEQLKRRPPAEQAVEQVRHINDLIDRDRQQIDPSRFIDVQYEDFCDDVYGTLSTLDRFFEQHRLVIKNGAAVVPGRFERRTEIRIDKALYDQIVNYVRR